MYASDGATWELSRADRAGHGARATIFVTGTCPPPPPGAAIKLTNLT